MREDTNNINEQTTAYYGELESKIITNYFSFQFSPWILNKMPVIHLKGISYIHLQAGEKKKIWSPLPNPWNFPTAGTIQPHGIRGCRSGRPAAVDDQTATLITIQTSSPIWPYRISRTALYPSELSGVRTTALSPIRLTAQVCYTCKHDVLGTYIHFFKCDCDNEIRQHLEDQHNSVKSFPKD